MTALEYTTGSIIATRISSQSFDTADQAELDAIALAVNDFIENYIGAPIGPTGSDARTYDGNGRDRLLIRGGINDITSLRIKDLTGGTYTTIDTSTYALRPYDHERPGGWPAFEVVLLSELAPAYTTFTRGYATVEVTPGSDDATGWGWPAIPPELSQLAIVLGTRMWQSRQSGETLVIGSNDFGQSIARFLPEPEYRAMLDRYRHAVSNYDWV